METTKSKIKKLSIQGRIIVDQTFQEKKIVYLKYTNKSFQIPKYKKENTHK